MSTSTVITTPAHSMEYILLIEGIGWLVDEQHGLSAGIEGDVFATADLNGDLGSKLSSTSSTNLLSSNQARGTDALASTTGFTAVDSASIQSSAATSWQGLRSLAVSPSTSINGTRGGAKTNAVAASASTTYVASFYARKGSGSMVIRAYLRDEVNGIDGTAVTETIDDSGEWVRVQCTVTTGGGSPTLSLYVLENAESATKVFYYIDGLQIETGSTATEWYSGTRRAGAATVHTGLMLPSSVGDKIDPLTFAHEVGGMDFTIVDYDEYLLDNVTPTKTPDEAVLDSSIAVTAVDVVLTNGADFATGDMAWIGGRELVKLGTKSGAGPHTYSDSVRGYLGTPRGKVTVGFPSEAGMAWDADTVVQSSNRFMYNRRVRLYAHVPGEPASGMTLVYAGRLRGMSSDGGGTSWRFESSGEQVNAYSRVRTANQAWTATQEYFLRPDGRPYYPYTATASSATGYPQTINESVAGAGLARVNINLDLGTDGSGQWNIDKYQAMTVYQYRTEPGGTAGAKAAFFSSAPQAPTVNGDAYCCDSYMQVGERIIRVIKKRPDDGVGAYTYAGDRLMCDAVNVFGDWWLEWNTETQPVKFLLDNVGDEWRLSRFAVNRVVRRNPIDVLLMFLTSMHDEFVVADTGSGSTTTNIVLAANALGETDDYWRGYALHCVEGSTNKGYARRIISSTVGSSNAVVVERAFPGAPSSGQEFQVRNSLYDVLPIGWGLAVHNSKIDIAQFERVRDRFLADARIGKFILGAGARTDILSLLLEDLCQAHNILIFIGRDGRLTCRYMGEALGDGVIDDYVSVAKADIVGDVGDLQYHLDKPIGAVDLRVRSVARSVISIAHEAPRFSGSYYEFGARQYVTAQAPSIDGATTTKHLVSPELASAYGEGALDTVVVSAMFNSADDCSHVEALAHQRLSRYAAAPPTTTFRLGIHMVESVQAGTYLSITHDSIVDPYTGTVGLSSRVGRVLRSEVILSETDPGIEVECELLPNVAGALVAPAAEVVSKGSDANGQYLKCYPDKYVADPDNDRDHNYFAVNDRVELRDKTGALKEDLGTITGFGSDFVSDPTVAVDSDANVRIYVSDSSITSSVATGDYITFKPWSASNTTRMNSYAAYANSSGALTGGADPKEYG